MEHFDVAELTRTYRKLLLDGVVPFWLRYGIDERHGGVLSCMSEEGVVLSGDKYLWSQARSVWTFAALYNRIEKEPAFLRAAENSMRFLLAHGRDANGDWVYRTDREGNAIEGPISVYADCFAVYGLSEYFRATGDPQILDVALRTYERIGERIAAPDFHDTAPTPLKPGRKPHAVPMILTEVTNELIITTGDARLEDRLSGFLDAVMNRFLQPGGPVLEYLDADYRRLPPPEGTAVEPGHALESMWFVIHAAVRRGDVAMVRSAVDAIRWHCEAGWEREHGGILLGIDAEGGTPYIPNWDKKPWWVHTEALYALLLAYIVSNKIWSWEWYRKLHAWSFAHYPLPCGEWRQRLTREGKPTTDLIALPVKDPFHLPRAAILILQRLGELKQ